MGIHLRFDKTGKFPTKLYDDYFSFPIVHFPFLSNNILISQAYNVFVFFAYRNSLMRGQLLTSKLFSCLTCEMLQTFLIILPYLS